MKDGLNFYLDYTESGGCLIRRGNEEYTAGVDKKKALELIDRLNEGHRPNVQQGGANEIYVCWNDHEKGEDCNYVREI